jgi:hypothetical protein
MPYEYSRVSIRQDVATEFWDFTTEQLANIKATYDDTNRRISFGKTLSEDGLTETRHHVWASVEDWDAYNTEYDECWTARDLYNSSHEIISIRVES